ncbi:hypothetical protein [Corallococcus aberystwythensis]|uniref:Uncharacterized protein n=1 Tax=Corallococcus aberystwythensis TaxID=2316722 RepID=A0A3A8PM26_9BACT|nr:hypothetical protein [Corallococcus aberystwythensis]RKH55721.1 hypothetical protein D7W81_35650 [Corallococcus aberystwythensis]
MDILNKIIPFICSTLGVLYGVVFLLSFILELTKILWVPVREFFMGLTFDRVIRGMRILLPAALAILGLTWFLVRPWVAPQGTPLERCLKGQIPREFSKEDRRNVEFLWSLTRHYNDKDTRIIEEESLGAVPD